MSPIAEQIKNPLDSELMDYIYVTNKGWFRWSNSRKVYKPASLLGTNEYEIGIYHCLQKTDLQSVDFSVGEVEFHKQKADIEASPPFTLTKRNKRGDPIATFASPMTKNKWEALVSLQKLASRFTIKLPNGYQLKYGEHRHILRQKPKNFGEYVRIAYYDYFSQEDQELET